MNYKFKVRILIFSLLTIFLGCGQAFSAAKISMIGTDDAEELMEEISEAFMEKYSDIKIDLGEGEGSGQGIRSAGLGEVDFGITARAIKESESGYRLEQVNFARIPIVFAVNPSVKLTGLTVEQTRALYSGSVKNWSEIGGPDQTVRLIKRHEGESAFQALREQLEGWDKLAISPKGKIVNSEDEVLDILSDKKGTIGFAVIGEIEEEGLNGMSLDGVSPADADYPVHTPLGLVYQEERLNDSMKAFIAFVQSEAVVPILNKFAVSPVQQ